MNRINFKLSAFFTLIVGLLAGFSAMAMSQTTSTASQGQLYLVSVGSGDPDNMTLKAQKTLQKADLILIMGGKPGPLENELQGKVIMDAGHLLFREVQPKNLPPKMRKSPEALTSQRKKVRQAVRNAIEEGRNVAVIEHGDPTIFGPHIAYMKEFADLDPIIIPGMSSFNAANAALGQSMMSGANQTISLTAAFQLHSDTGLKQAVDSIKSGTTLVLFMNRNLSDTIQRLTFELPETTPVAIVALAGYETKQRVWRGTIGNIVEHTGGEKLPAHLLYIGTSVQ